MGVNNISHLSHPGVKVCLHLTFVWALLTFFLKERLIGQKEEKLMERLSFIFILIPLD